MVAFIGAEHGFRVVSLFVSRKLAIFAARWAKFGHLGSEHDDNPKLLHGSVIAAFMGVEHGFKTVSLSFPRLWPKRPFCLPIGHFEIGTRTPNYFHGI